VTGWETVAVVGCSDMAHSWGEGLREHTPYPGPAEGPAGLRDPACR
jgi:hypothetical protein